MANEIRHTEYTAFSERLCSSLIAAKYSTGPSEVARQFNARAADDEVTIHAVRKWLRGESIPAHHRLIILAQWLNVSAQWLRFGDESTVTAIAPGTLNAASDEMCVLTGYRKLDEKSKIIVKDLLHVLLERQD